MNCINCGTTNDDGAVFCLNCGKYCGKPLNEVVGNQQSSSIGNQKSGSSGGGYPLSNLTAKLFSVLFEVILWIILVGGFVVGGILADDFGSPILFILGGIAGFVIIILTGGLVSLFIKLVNNSEEVKKQLRDMQKQPQAIEGVPSKPKGTPFKSEGIPFRPKGTPFNTEGIPFKPKGTPFKPEGTPFRAKGTPFEPEGTTVTLKGVPNKAIP